MTTSRHNNKHKLSCDRALLIQLFTYLLIDLGNGNVINIVLRVRAVGVKAPAIRFNGHYTLRPCIGGNPGRIGAAEYHNQRDTQSSGDVAGTSVICYHEFSRF